MEAEVISFQGRRQFQEDTFSLIGLEDGSAFVGAIFDGHSGAGVSKLAEQRFPELVTPPADAKGIGEQLTNAFLTIDRESIGMDAGAVACAFFTDGKNITVVNSGDAEIYLVSNGFATRLTEQHRITTATEQARCVKAGAKIIYPYVYIPDGRGLMPTRSLGDHDFHPYGIIAQPYLHQLHTEDPYYLVAASDGLWDVVNPLTLAGVCNGKRSAKDAAKALRAISEPIAHDNVTLIVVKK